ncbi:hypothetical protein [Qipengyuania sp. JC766]|uniref:hypothetical protein n=1 Tax=Qipengyuania sp. JC766 TaxID=3232139 RepID=UPI003458A796
MRVAFLLGLALLAGCNDNNEATFKDIAPEGTDLEKVVEDIAPPPVAIEPEAVSESDMDKDQITGDSCAFYKEGSETPVVIMHDTSGVMKVKGKTAPLASDAGAEPIFGSVKPKYVGTEFEVEIRPSARGTGADSFAATAIARDGADRTVWEAAGELRCRMEAS